MKSSLRFTEDQSLVSNANAPPIKVPSASGGQVDASCNTTITPTCLKELYNAVGFVPSAENGNHIAATGYLGEIANFQDFKLFATSLVPAAENFTFNIISINGQQSVILAPWS